MGKIVFDMSMSLDGYVRAPGETPEEPLGAGGQHLHDWGDDPASAEFTGSYEEFGAVICGRRTYDDSLPFWGAEGPVPSIRVPVIIVTHEAPQDVPEGAAYYFATSIGDALRQARQYAGSKNISVAGPDIGGQLIAAGEVDEIVVHLVPVLFGGGLPMFSYRGEQYVQLEVARVIDTPRATHVVYRVMK